MNNTTADESSRLVIAYLGKPIGLKGQIKLHPQSDFLDQFKNGAKFQANSQELTIETFDKNRMLVKFIGFDTVERAKELSNKELVSTIEDSRKNCKLGKDEFFWFDIISCKLIENGEILGVIEDIERFTGQDYLVVSTSDDLITQNMPKSFLIPYTDRYIISVDQITKKYWYKMLGIYWKQADEVCFCHYF